jgi:hypothetical protein
VRKYFFPVLAVLASIKLRSLLANGTTLLTPASKSKSNPSMLEDPNGRRAEGDDCGGPKRAQILSAPISAAEAEEKPPSVYVAPPIERRIVFPYEFWHVAISALFMP